MICQGMIYSSTELPIRRLTCLFCGSADAENGPDVDTINDGGSTAFAYQW